MRDTLQPLRVPSLYFYRVSQQYFGTFIRSPLDCVISTKLRLRSCEIWKPLANLPPRKRVPSSNGAEKRRPKAANNTQYSSALIMLDASSPQDGKRRRDLPSVDPEPKPHAAVDPLPLQELLLFDSRSPPPVTVRTGGGESPSTTTKDAACSKRTTVFMDEHWCVRVHPRRVEMVGPRER